jgi:hypothetical protein
MRRFLVLQVACAAYLSSSLALAQDISGKWYGTLDNYSVSDPRRVLSITQKASSTVCTWDEVGLSINAPAKCALNNGALDLVTASHNNVHLVPTGSSLVGTFTLTRDRGTFQIAMKRTPDFAITSLTSTRICDQTVEYMPGVSPSGAPEYVRGFLGKWQGTIAYSAVIGWCAGFVIQAVGNGGAALSAKYAWSTGSGSGFNGYNNMGVSKRSGGRVSEGVLQFPGRNSFELRLVGPNIMSGFYSQNGSKYPVSLSRL